MGVGEAGVHSNLDDDVLEPREPPVLDGDRGSVAAELVGLLEQQYLKSFRVVLVVEELVHQVVAGVLWVDRREL